MIKQPTQLGVKPNFAPVTNAIILAHSRNQTRKDQIYIAYYTKITNFKKLKKEVEKKKTRRLKNKEKKRKDAENPLKKRVECKVITLNKNNDKLYMEVEVVRFNEMSIGV